MSKGGEKSPAAIGFLTVVQQEPHGLFGGYLILNLAGRPLEFHCTAPVKANRVQQILYGPTLQPFLYGEQIGQTLIVKGSLQPLVVCTDLEPVMSVRDHVEVPLALVLPAVADASATSASVQFRIDAAHGTGAGLHFNLGRNRLAVSPAHEGDRQQILDRIKPVAETFDWAEPFGRIREAIGEAQRAGK